MARTTVGGLAFLVGLLATIALTLAAFMPRRVSAFEQWVDRHPRRVQAVFSLVLLFTGWGYLEHWWAEKARDEQLRVLTSASSTYATADDVRVLRKEMREGFDRVEGAIKTGQAQTSTTISKTPTTTTM